MRRARLQNRAVVACGALAALVALLAFDRESNAAAEERSLVFSGACDGSAAVAFDAQRILVANDENNHLRLYSLSAGGAPLASWNLSTYLGGEKEADIEGGALLGGVAYWITSHGRNKNGKVRDERHALFATSIEHDGVPSVEGVGGPYRLLTADMLKNGAIRDLVSSAIGGKGDDPALAPEKNGLNIEGLSASSDGRSLHIGLRNPLDPSHRAIVLTLENPHEVVMEKKPARFGKPNLLTLGGLGIRSLEQSSALHALLLVAGPVADDGGAFRLYQWSDGTSLRSIRSVADFKPEAMVVLEGGRVLLLSDDGTDSCKAKAAKDQTFRGLEISVTDGAAPASATP